MGRLCESRSAAYTRSAEAISHWLSLKSPGEAIDCAFIGRAARAAFANKVAAVPEEVIASLDKSIATRAEVLAAKRKRSVHADSGDDAPVDSVLRAWIDARRVIDDDASLAAEMIRAMGVGVAAVRAEMGADANVAEVVGDTVRVRAAGATKERSSNSYHTSFRKENAPAPALDGKLGYVRGVATEMTGTLEVLIESEVHSLAASYLEPLARDAAELADDLLGKSAPFMAIAFVADVEELLQASPPLHPPW